MKHTTIILIILLLASLAAQAQTRDTVHRGDPRYLYDGLYDSPDSCARWIRGGALSAGTQFFAEDSTTIYGVAFLLRTPFHPDDTVPTNNTADIGCELLLAEPNRPKPLLVRERNPILMKELVDVFRHRKEYDIGVLCEDIDAGSWPLLSESDIANICLIEFYYPTPLVVVDSFFATIQRRNFSSDMSEYLDTLLNKNGVGQWLPERMTVLVSCGNPDYWYYHTIHYKLVAFPILVPPTEDRPEERNAPAAPRLAELNAGRQYATVEYNLNPEVGDMQLAIAPWLSDPDSATILSRERHLTPIYTFPNLDTTQTYAVWQRDQCYYRFTCHSDTAIWSDWSEPLIFSFAPPAPDTLWLNDSTYVLGGDTTVIHHEGIWEVSDSGNQISVFPNPTTGDVTVDCGGLRVERIELLDLQGRVLMREEPDAVSFKLQTSALAPGAYLIRVHTAEGVFSRRIVKSE